MAESALQTHHQSRDLTIRGLLVLLIDLTKGVSYVDLNILWGPGCGCHNRATEWVYLVPLLLSVAVGPECITVGWVGKRYSVFWYALLYVFLVLARKRELDALLMSYYCKCLVALPHGAEVWSAVCDWGISWSYSFPFKERVLLNKYNFLTLAIEGHTVRMITK